MNCGWCSGTPAYVDKGGTWECPSCHNVIFKSEKGPNKIVELMEAPKPKVLVPKEVAPKEEKARRPRRKKEELPWQKVADRKRFSTKFKEWLAWQIKRNLKCKQCKAPLVPVDPTWEFRGEEWRHACRD